MTIMSRRRGVLIIVAGLAATGSLVLAFAASTRPGHSRATTTPVSALRAEDASVAREDAAATGLAFSVAPVLA